MLLCDAAAAPDGKLYVLGGGWSQILEVGRPVNMGLAIKIGVPWDRANEPHVFQAKLITADGQDVHAGEDQLIEAAGTFELGRPPGLAPGTQLDAVLALNFTALALEPDAYVWELRVDDEVLARAPFRVGPAPRRGMAE